MVAKIILLKNETVPFDPYKEELTKHDTESFFVPLLTHQSINQLEIVHFLTSNNYLDNFKAFIITSQRCIESLDTVLSMIDDKDVLTRILNKPAYTVGPATYDVLSKLGFTDIRGGIDAGNGTILSDIIIEDEIYKEGNKNILFLTGEIRKDIIPRKLTAAGFNLQELVAYKTNIMEDVVERYSKVYNELIKNKNDLNWIVFFSPQGTEYITEHLLNHKPDFKIASIGPTTQTYLLDKGITPDYVAKKPNAVSLIQGILEI
ncbi:hypothetical protein C6P40_002505 [Pichia californica]|uniref:Tetrapyrrole biosynthesis uroporphyrinogen III synthase domain-containing protein n=1 Tax=Pichia californica TaxID=460514 RepID=A0A9P7BEQ3_9ASCO|nr:hypothetical protein C6P42_002484 [[Candida] californica]KAG0687320.1 hypothetical protein C6P40_002505 [[Candida] californica]